jgi:hypothetical protein
MEDENYLFCDAFVTIKRMKLFDVVLMSHAQSPHCWLENIILAFSFMHEWGTVIARTAIKSPLRIINLWIIVKKVASSFPLQISIIFSSFSNHLFCGRRKILFMQSFIALMLPLVTSFDVKCSNINALWKINLFLISITILFFICWFKNLFRSTLINLTQSCRMLNATPRCKHNSESVSHCAN